MTEEEIAELRYEAGMYQSLYENAAKEVEQMRSRLDLAHAAMAEIVETWEWVSVDPVDRGYSSVSDCIADIKQKLAVPQGQQT